MERERGKIHKEPAANSSDRCTQPQLRVFCLGPSHTLLGIITFLEKTVAPAELLHQIISDKNILTITNENTSRETVCAADRSEAKMYYDAIKY